MNKVLIVEDEKAARDRILSMRVWKSSNYRICAASNNGKEGILAYRATKPDIIITDIEMPVMNGLDFIAEIRKENKSIPIIILSCYESFSYAQKAIKLKVNDYLIKDFLEEEVLYSALMNALKINRMKKGSDTTEKSSFSSVSSTELFTIFEENDRYIINRLTQRFYSKTSFNLLYLHVDYYDRSIVDIQSVISAITNELRFEYDSMVSYLGNGYIGILLTESNYSSAAETAARIIDCVDHHCSHSITVAVGNTFSNPEEIRKEYLKVQELLKYSIYLGQNRVILSSHVSQIGWLDPELIDHILHQLKLYILRDDKKDFFNYLKQLYQIDTAGMIEYNYIEYVNTNLITLLLNFINENHLKESEKFDNRLLSFKEIHSMETIHDIYLWFRKKFAEIFSFADKQSGSVFQNTHIRKIISIIKNEYKEDLSLETLADRIGIHKVYLSRLFKKETGKTCYEYIQNIRIQKAKDLLLSSSYRIAEVAEKTGFRSYDQFAVVFKKSTGDTPTSFQKKFK